MVLRKESTTKIHLGSAVAQDKKETSESYRLNMFTKANYPSERQLLVMTLLEVGI